jgi:type IV secretion system protein VirB10
MKNRIVWGFSIWLYGASALMAQTAAQMQKADLAIPFGTVAGKIVLAGDHLVFIDEQRPEQSFVIARTEVEDLTVQDKTASLELRRPVQDRSGERSRLNFRLANGETSSLKRWYSSAATAPALSTRNRSQLQSMPSRPSVIAVPANTIVQLQLNQGLSSRTAQKGDAFSASVTAPVVVDNTVVIPEGSRVYGRVTEVLRAERRQNGSVAVAFYELELPTKEKIEIHGSLASLEDEKGEKQQVGQEGEVEGKSTTKRNVAFIGGGAGAGALVGAVAGGGKGAGIGAAVGAGVGTLGALMAKGNDVQVASGTDIAMALDREVTVPISR